MTVSLRVMSAGAGYAYLLKSVVAGDGDRALSTSLTRYYQEKGTPPGFWLGSGLPGLADAAVTSGALVTEQQLRRLLGAGCHPVTGQPLGRAFFHFKTVQERIRARVARLEPGERAGEVERIEAEERARDRPRTVAGYDLTFSVPKSVSALWAVADAGTQELIVRAHHDAMADVIALLERDVAATRVGAQGVAPVRARGVVATAYDHYDSRASDPQLHTHVVVANRVQAASDGGWRTLDGRPLHAAVVAMSEHYNALLADRLAQVFGFRFEQRSRGEDRNPAWEIAGVSDALLAEFSSRSVDIEAEKQRLIEEYVRVHGRQPFQATVVRLREQATLATRPEKTAKSLAELTTEWKTRASGVLGADAPTWAQHLLAATERPVVLRADDVAVDELERVARVVVGEVGTKRSTWRRWNLYAEASRQTMGLRFASTRDRETVVAAIVDAAQRSSVQLTPSELTSTPQAFRRDDGTSVFRPAHATVYSSAAVLQAEDRLLRLSHARSAPTVSLGTVAAVASRTGRRGHALAVDQRQVVEQLAVSARVVDVLVGPAGAGKTTTLATLRHAWEHAHGAGSVIGLAPSAAAAQVLADDLDIDCENTAKWLHEHARGAWALRPGQLVIVDEASLAGTFALDRLTTHAAEAGAKLVLVGDWAQLGAIDAGGAFGMLVRDRDDAPELVDVRRFTHDWEKTSSLRLRLGDTDVIDTYDEHGRLLDGDHETVLDAAYEAWRRDTATGHSSVLVTETLDTVAELNARARADRVAAGEVDVAGVQLRDDTMAGRGDVIVTRRNERRLSTGRGWVKNGDRWTVLREHGDGSLTVRRVGARWRGTLTLPAWYVAGHVDLGYAISTHRAQGVTVDTSHVVVHSSSMTRETFYVAMTRGRTANTAYVATDEHHLEPHQQTPDTEVTARSVLFGVLQHSGAELSAHETIDAEHETWSNIGQLAAEYETLAQHAQGDAVIDLLHTSRLSTRQVDRVAESDTFGSLVAELRRLHADAYHTPALMRRATQAGDMDRVDDPATVLRHRLRKLAAATSPGAGMQRDPQPRLIAGLIPEAAGPMPDDMANTLTELADRIEQRADDLVRAAIAAREPWILSAGDPPADGIRREQWWAHARVIAAYRDRHHIAGADPLGTVPDTDLGRLDYHRAATALTRARSVRRHEDPPAQIDPPQRTAGLDR